MNSEKVLTKTVKRYGNSGGVYLPSSWIGGEVELRLARRPARPERDIPLALGDKMRHVISIILYGSYARGEQSGESDIDVLIVTDEHPEGLGKTPEGLKEMNYDLRAMTRNEVERAAESDAVFRKSLEGSVALFNESFLDELVHARTGGALTERIDFAKSSFGIIKSLFGAGGENAELVYPLIMRIKEMLLIRCILDGKKYSLGLLHESLRKAGIPEHEIRSLLSLYRAVRDGKRAGKSSFGEDAIGKLIDILGELIEYAEKKEKAGKGH